MGHSESQALGFCVLVFILNSFSVLVPLLPPSRPAVNSVSSRRPPCAGHLHAILGLARDPRQLPADHNLDVQISPSLPISPHISPSTTSGRSHSGCECPRLPEITRDCPRLPDHNLDVQLPPPSLPHPRAHESASEDPDHGARSRQVQPVHLPCHGRRARRVVQQRLVHSLIIGSS